MLLEGKIALVTGAAKGIGRAIALMLAAEGATVVVNYNGSKEKAEQTVEEIKALGADGRAWQCNVADTEAAQAMIKDIIAEYGKLGELPGFLQFPAQFFCMSCLGKYISRKQNILRGIINSAMTERLGLFRNTA